MVSKVVEGLSKQLTARTSEPATEPLHDSMMQHVCTLVGPLAQATTVAEPGPQGHGIEVVAAIP